MPDPRPIYQQIAEDIKEQILRGVLFETERTPSTHDLSDYFQVNPTTAGRALTQLVQEGIIEKRRGIGMFVVKGACERIRTQRAREFAHSFIDPMLKEASVLKMSRDSLLKAINSRADELSSRGDI